MYDSTSAQDIPVQAEMVAGYIDGVYRWDPFDWRRFPTAVRVYIATSAQSNQGFVLDVEQGDASPPQCPAWIRMRQAAGLVKPTIYCARTAVTAVQESCSGLTYSLWVADWTGLPHPVDGAAAVQYADSSMTGHHYDLSAVYDPFWPAGMPAPLPTGEEMTIDLARILVFDWFIGVLRRHPSSQSEIDYWASQMVQPTANWEAVYTAFLATPEAQAALQRGTTP